MSAAVEVKLTAYNTGLESEDDWTSWIEYVARHIEGAVGFPVEVDAYELTGRWAGGAEDEIRGASDEQAASIREAIQSMWTDWCGWAGEQFASQADGSAT